MTNYEWVKENQKETIREALADYVKLYNVETADAIMSNDDVIREAILVKCSIYLTTNTIVPYKASHAGVDSYLYMRKGMVDWLDEEHIEKMKDAYPEGTVLVGSNGRWYWYCGVNSTRNKHIVYTTPLGLTSYNPYYRELFDDEFFKHNFEPLNPNVVVDNKRNLIVAVAKTDN